jgi:hypothetical protein
MATKNWLTRLNNLEGAVDRSFDPHKNVIRCSSPSVNFSFGKGHGLPRGLTLALGGFPKGGKTLLGKMFTGQLHKDDPTAHVVKYNTELRAMAQGTPEDDQRIWGIDPDRISEYEVNSPMLIFDTIEKDLAAMCQEGFPLALVIIDSISGIQGRRSMNADSIEVQQIGDLALTLGEGFKRILPVQRKHKFAVILTCQIRAEMDKVEIMRKNTVKMSLPLAVQHYAEYSMFVEPNRNAAGRVDLTGHDYKDEAHGDINGDGDQLAHRIKVRMKDSSCGPKGRGAEFTLDYNKGLINANEEIYLLAKNRGIITLPVNNTKHVFHDREFNGKPATLEAIRSEPELANAILAEVFAGDNNADEKDADE